MLIYVRLKSAGKRKDVLSRAPYEIPDNTCTLRQLLTAMVGTETARYRERQADEALLRVLTAEAVETQASEGKVSFGRVHSDGVPDAEKAVSDAIQAWEDGLVRVFLEDDEITEIDCDANFHPGAEITILRLTFLAGSMW